MADVIDFSEHGPHTTWLGACKCGEMAIHVFPRGLPEETLECNACREVGNVKLVPGGNQLREIALKIKEERYDAVDDPDWLALLHILAARYMDTLEMHK